MPRPSPKVERGSGVLSAGGSGHETGLKAGGHGLTPVKIIFPLILLVAIMYPDGQKRLSHVCCKSGKTLSAAPAHSHK